MTQKIGPAATVTDPLHALQELAGEVLAVKNYLHEQMEALRALTTYDVKGAEQIRAVFAAYERALDRSVSTLATIAKLNIDERLARISEEQGHAIKRVFEYALIQLGYQGREFEDAKLVIGQSIRRMLAEERRVIDAK